MAGNIFKKAKDILTKESLLSSYQFTTDFKKNYLNLWNSLNDIDFCPYSDTFNRNWSELASLKLESVGLYQTIDAISEGEVAGLCDLNGDLIKISNDNQKNSNIFKGIFLNEVPIKNTNTNDYNYQRAFCDIKYGAEDQEILTQFSNESISFQNSYETYGVNSNLIGFAPDKAPKFPDPDVNFIDKEGYFKDTNGSLLDYYNIYRKDNGTSFIPVNNNVAKILRQSPLYSYVKSIENLQPIKFNQKIYNNNAAFIQINISTVLQTVSKADGSVEAASVNFVVKISYEDDDILLGEGGSSVYLLCNIIGIATSQYEKTYIFPLPPYVRGVNRYISIFRADEEFSSEASGSIRNLSIKSLSEVVQKKMNYTNTCVAGNLFDARALSQIPKRTFHLKLKKIKVPSNYDPETRSYDGNWDGTFKKELQWSDNPAWVFYDIVTNTRYGLGKYGFKKSYVDKWSLYSIAKYCDELVSTNNTSITKSLDFSINKNSTLVSIDDSSSNLGESWFQEHFKEGKTVCLFEVKDSDSNIIDIGYKRIIINPIYQNNTYSFTIAEEPKIDNLFKNYKELQREYFSENSNFSSKEWFILKVLNTQDSAEPYITDYLAGKGLNEEVRTGKIIPQEKGALPILEPRFTCNIYLDSFQAALDTLNDIAAIFRGIVHWANGYIITSADRKKDATMLFTNADVKEGVFKYSGSAKTARHTAILVRYNDEFNDFKPEVEYIEDDAGIREYGYILKEIVALGTTSRSQAYRIGKWMLYTNQTENNLVQFSTNIKGSYLMPGDVIYIQDQLRSIKRYGGRVTNINYAEKKITIDKGIKEDISNQIITLIVPKENKRIRDLNKKAKNESKLTYIEGGNYEGISDSELSEARQPQIKQFTIDSVEENSIITISETEDEDFNLIPNGSIWSIQNTSENLNIKEIEYRVISITEESLNDYTITAMSYNRTKFDAIDKGENLEKNQESKTQILSVGNFPNSMNGDGVQSEEIKDANAIETYYDAHFENKQTEYDKFLSVNFKNLIGENELNEDNTGGYIIEVYKDGRKVRFALDGYDNTSFSVFLGDSRLYKRISYDIYRYDSNYKLENLKI